MYGHTYTSSRSSIAATIFDSNMNSTTHGKLHYPDRQNKHEIEQHVWD